MLGSGRRIAGDVAAAAGPSLAETISIWQFRDLGQHNCPIGRVSRPSPSRARARNSADGHGRASAPLARAVWVLDERKVDGRVPPGPAGRPAASGLNGAAGRRRAGTKRAGAGPTAADGIEGRTRRSMSQRGSAEEFAASMVQAVAPRGGAMPLIGARSRPAESPGRLRSGPRARRLRRRLHRRHARPAYACHRRAGPEDPGEPRPPRRRRRRPQDGRRLRHPHADPARLLRRGMLASRLRAAAGRRIRHRTVLHAQGRGAPGDHPGDRRSGARRRGSAAARLARRAGRSGGSRRGREGHRAAPPPGLHRPARLRSPTRMRSSAGSTSPAR